MEYWIFRYTEVFYNNTVPFCFFWYRSTLRVMVNQQMHSKVWTVSGLSVLRDGWAHRRPRPVVIKGDVKPSQWSDVLYKTWMAVKNCGEVISGHCTCMAGLSEVVIMLALCCTNACMRHNNHTHLLHCLISGYLQRRLSHLSVCLLRMLILH